ncbi:hypothetical protein JCM8208_006844, partial [Rhodotorula glutinis]
HGAGEDERRADTPINDDDELYALDPPPLAPPEPAPSLVDPWLQAHLPIHPRGINFARLPTSDVALDNFLSRIPPTDDANAVRSSFDVNILKDELARVERASPYAVRRAFVGLQSVATLVFYAFDGLVRDLLGEKRQLLREVELLSDELRRAGLRVPLVANDLSVVGYKGADGVVYTGQVDAPKRELSPAVGANGEQEEG